MSVFFQESIFLKVATCWYCSLYCLLQQKTDNNNKDYTVYLLQWTARINKMLLLYLLRFQLSIEDNFQVKFVLCFNTFTLLSLADFKYLLSIISSLFEVSALDFAIFIQTVEQKIHFSLYIFITSRGLYFGSVNNKQRE